jgi:hypothetical protein
VWARPGFSPPTLRNRHVLGAKGQIVAVLFGYPLMSPPPASPRQNKILWIPRHLTSRMDLYIRAQRMTGCWRPSLRWSGGSDTLDVRYRMPPPA